MSWSGNRVPYVPLPPRVAVPPGLRYGEIYQITALFLVSTVCSRHVGHAVGLWPLAVHEGSEGKMSLDVGSTREKLYQITASNTQSTAMRGKMGTRTCPRTLGPFRYTALTSLLKHPSKFLDESGCMHAFIMKFQITNIAPSG